MSEDATERERTDWCEWLEEMADIDFGDEEWSANFLRIAELLRSAPESEPDKVLAAFIEQAKHDAKFREDWTEARAALLEFDVVEGPEVSLADCIRLLAARSAPAGPADLAELRADVRRLCEAESAHREKLSPVDHEGPRHYYTGRVDALSWVLSMIAVTQGLAAPAGEPQEAVKACEECGFRWVPNEGEEDDSCPVCEIGVANFAIDDTIPGFAPAPLDVRVRMLAEHVVRKTDLIRSIYATLDAVGAPEEVDTPEGLRCSPEHRIRALAAPSGLVALSTGDTVTVARLVQMWETQCANYASAVETAGGLGNRFTLTQRIRELRAVAPDAAAVVLANAVAQVANAMDSLEQAIDRQDLWDALDTWRAAVGIPGDLWPLPEIAP